MKVAHERLTAYAERRAAQLRTALRLPANEAGSVLVEARTEEDFWTFSDALGAPRYTGFGLVVDGKERFLAEAYNDALRQLAGLAGLAAQAEQTE